MTNIREASFTIFVALTLLFSSIYTYAHEPCMTEKATRDNAKRRYNQAQVQVTSLIGQINAKIIHMLLAKKHTLDEITKHVKEKEALEKELTQAQKTRDREKSAYQSAAATYSSCMSKAFRNCPGNCEVAHTQNVTSCECNCNYGSYGCACGPCSSRSNGGG